MISIVLEFEKQFFTFDNLIKDRWRDLIREAQNKFKIFFDLENNDTKKIQRIIEIPQKQWTTTKCRFKCELYSAGGDWQVPVLYFRCQLIDGYALNMSTFNNSHFVYIPGKEEGNYHLVKTKKGWSSPDNNDYKEGIDPERNERDCWESLKKYLENLVDLEIQKIRSEYEESNDNINSEEESHD